MGRRRLRRRQSDAPRNTRGFVLGCLPRLTLLGGAGPPRATFEVARDVFRPYPRTDWPDILAANAKADADWLTGDIRGIKQQGNEGSCTSNATTGAFETVKVGAGRDNVIEMSAMSLYKQVGRSPNSGSSLDANCTKMAEFGALPVTGTNGSVAYRHTHPRTGFRKALPDGWQETAKHFRLQEWLDVDSFESLATCLLRRIPVVIGYHIGRGGHSVYAVELVRKDRLWYVDCAGSWGGDYNGNGHHLLPERTVTRGIPSFGGFAPLVTTEAG